MEPKNLYITYVHATLQTSCPQFVLWANYLQMTISFLCHMTIPFVVSFIFEAVGLVDGTFTKHFLIPITTMLQIPGSIRLPWKVMRCTPQISPITHNILLKGSKQVYHHPWFKDLHRNHIQSISWTSRPSTMVIKNHYFSNQIPRV
jgi:hypothetical protein